MGQLVYAAIASLDGYVADIDGRWDWSIPDDDVHAAVNDLERTIGTMLLGRRMYDVLVAWETMETAGEPAAIADFAQLWRATDKVVYSRTLQEPSSARTRIERELDARAVAEMKASSPRDVSIAGPELAGQAIKAGLVDEIHLFLSPVIVGGGTRALPDDARVDLELVGERRFANGVVHLRYRTA